MHRSCMIRGLAKQARAVSYTTNAKFSVSGVRGTQQSYTDAIKCLNTRQTGFKAYQERLKAGTLLDKEIIEKMRHYLQLLGHKPSDLDALNVVHVAGTKGKGTTCAFVNSMLMACQRSLGQPRKVGLYTSPHLISVRERIRINAEPISEEMFARYFFEVWEAFGKASESMEIPPYFKFLTLMSFHVFLREGVDVAIYEVGMGGELDSTNILNRPAATGITTLGIDHVQALGDSIEQIAWHKAGIFKEGTPAFSVTQVPDAVHVLMDRASERKARLEWVRPMAAIRKVKLNPMEDFQINNASIAVRLTTTVLEKMGVTISVDDSRPPKLVTNSGSPSLPVSLDQELPIEFVQGLENVKWRARCETKVIGNEKFYLDGAHTPDSLEVASNWFGKVTSGTQLPRILVFNQQSDRNAGALLQMIHRVLNGARGINFEHVIFCTNVTSEGDGLKPDFVNKMVDSDTLSTLSHQNLMKGEWLRLEPKANVSVFSTIMEARKYVGSIAEAHGGAQTLVTGSFHLVGGFLSVLEGSDFGLDSLIDTAKDQA